jgi:hypothetical protein
MPISERNCHTQAMKLEFITMTITTATSIESIRINGERLWASLMELAKIGATPKGGVCRLTLTDLDKQGRDLVIGWAREAGMTITIDKIGNGFMRRAGRNNSLPPSLPAATSTPSPRAASSTATTACWRAWKWCAPSTTCASRPKPPSKSPSGPTKRVRALCRS